MPNNKTYTNIHSDISIIDLHFQGLEGTIASYLIPHRNGAVLIECGPGSTIQSLQSGLKRNGMKVDDITDVLLTHIHLDHAGASGWLANQGTRIHVHPAGAPHMINPEKLLNSAGRIYGDQMDKLWGEFLPVPEDKVHIVNDGETLEIEGLIFKAIDTPGHANHHIAYIFGDACFTGDIAGVRLQGMNHLRVPMPPPEFNLENWRQSLRKLAAEEFRWIAPTHFGFFDNPGNHLSSLSRELDNIENWMEVNLAQEIPLEDLNQRFLQWTDLHAKNDGLTDLQIRAYEAANPSWMSPMGMQRYWKKYRSS